MSPSRARILVANSTWKSWPDKRPGKQGQLLGPEPEGGGGAAGEDGQGLKGLGQGAHADPGLGVAQAMAQVAGGVHHRDVAPVATLHPGAAGYFD